MFEKEIVQKAKQAAEIQTQVEVFADVAKKWPENVHPISAQVVLSKNETTFFASIDSGLPALLAAFPPENAFLKNSPPFISVEREDSERAKRLTFPVWVCGQSIEHIKSYPLRVCWFSGKYSFAVSVPLEYLNGHIAEVKDSGKIFAKKGSFPASTMTNVGQQIVNYWGGASLHCQTTDGDEFKNFILSRS